MLTYAGQELVHSNAELLARVQEDIDPWWPFVGSAWSLPRPPAVDAAQGSPGLWPPARPAINTLYWPVGASRWACGWYLADEVVLAAARASQPRTFAFGDGTDTHSTSLFMLPAVPLERVSTSAPGLYLLPLVDDRFYWWQEAAPLSITGGTTTWAQVYAAIGTALGVTITAETVAAAYLKPSPSLAQARGPVPPLLDAVAAACGQRIVRELDGTVRAMAASTSLTRHLASLAALDGERLAGHQLDLGTS